MDEPTHPQGGLGGRPAAILRELCREPRLFVADDFATDEEVAHALAVAADEGALAARGVETSHGPSGFHFEMPVEGDPVLEALRRRILETVGLENDFGSTMRFRRYEAGQSHRAHRDAYTAGTSCLLVTALLYLTDAEEGGETHFPHARPAPLSVGPRRGRLAVWCNYLPDGREDPAAAHEALPVRKGVKATLASFIYRPLSYASGALAHALSGPDGGASARPPRPAFYCVNDRVPRETTDLLREACERRGVGYVEVDAPSFDYDPARRLPPGAMLYRPAVSVAAIRVEQFLHGPGVATFYPDDEDIYYDCLNQTLLHERAGLPAPLTIPCSTTRRDVLRSYVGRLGGFPVVLKVAGGAGGLGVMRADSFPALFSLVDFLRSKGYNPLLSSYVPDAVHWRLVVVGDRVAAAYKNVPDEDDFRTHASDEPAHYDLRPSDEMAEVAVSAVRLTRREFGGVDILEDPRGRLFLLEANFPCYFPQAQLVTGADIAGTMLEHLLRKAEAPR